VGLLSYWIFQRLMKSPLVSVLPDGAYRRWRPYSAPASWNSPRQWLLAACGVMLGAIVHLAWDAFTHEGARGVRMVPELSDPMLEVHHHVLTGATLLQGLSSLIGLMVVIAGIAYALRDRGPRTAEPRPLTAFERRTWVLVFALVTLGFCVGFLILDHTLGHWYHHRRWVGLGGLLIAGLGSVAIALLRALVLAALSVSLLMTGYLRAKR
jgi:hypothetical protein